MVRRMSRFELADGRELGVRSAAPSDARALRRLLDDVGSEAEVTILHVPGSCSARSLRGEISAAAAEPGVLMLCAYVGGELAGHLALSVERRPASRHVCQMGLAVRHADRGLGIGSALLDVALPWAVRHGISKVAVGVMAHNRRALRFFLAHGFRREGLRVGQFLRQGRAIDEILMARELTPAGDAASQEDPPCADW